MNDSVLLKYKLSPLSEAPTLLFLHGFIGCRHDWEELVGLLGVRYRALRIDLPGHGGSCPDLPMESYSMAGGAKLVIDVLDHCEIDRCSLVGYSMGGRLGLYLLTRYPGRFESAVIESASPGLRNEEERKARRREDAKLARRLREEPFSDFLHSWYGQSLFRTIDQTSPRFEGLLTRRQDSNPNALALSLDGMGTGAMPALWEDLSRLNLPVLFVAGEKDEKYRRLAGEMANLCLRGRAAIIPEAGHNVHFERPEEFVRILADFFGANL